MSKAHTRDGLTSYGITTTRCIAIWLKTDLQLICGMPKSLGATRVHIRG